MHRLSYGISAERPDIVYYAVDHRGIGGSEKLECPEQESKDSVKGATISEEEWPLHRPCAETARPVAQPDAPQCRRDIR
jgi:hypothetical protein